MIVYSAGSGSVHIILAPGGPSLIPGFYQELIDTLSRRYTVTTVAFTGTAPEPAAPFPGTIPEGAEELATAVDQLTDKRPTVLLGHSYGGAVAIEYLCANPASSIDASILISSFPSGAFIAQHIRNRMASFPPEFHDAVASGALEIPEGVATLMAKFWLPRHLCRGPFPQSFQTALQNLNTAFMNRVIGPSVFEPTGTILNWNRESDLAKISQPLLVLGGDHDYYPPDAVRGLPWSTPEASGPRQFAFSSSGSHSVWIEDPTRTYHSINAFIGEFVLHDT